MTIEELYRKMIEDDLFKDINQTKEIVGFILARTVAFSANDDSEEYREMQKQMRQYEEEFKTLFKDQKLWTKGFSEYLELAADTAAEADFLHFMKGFFEGAKFLLVLVLFSGDSGDENHYIRRVQ